jgi:nitroreductase/dihydropteridine reductase
MNIAEIAQRRYTTKAFNPNLRIANEKMDAILEVLRNAPSSVNSQPWCFMVAETTEGKLKVAQGMQGAFAYNEPKVRQASHVVVLCARKQLEETHLASLLDQESSDGRFATDEARGNQNKLRRHYVDLHRNQLHSEHVWMDKQIYLALGALLFAVGVAEIDACAMEGFDNSALDEALGLADKGLRSVVVVALGYRSDKDFNAKLPKSRLPVDKVIVRL